MVTVREIRQGPEFTRYQENKDKYLPASIEAANLRIPNRNIEADQPILKSDLEDLAWPGGVPVRLRPGMRAVNLSLPKDRAAGGLIARGDRVDVLLTTKVCEGSNCNKSATLSAYIARDLRVIVKRNTLWTVLRANPENMPVTFTLEANPYRAALIEFASNKGLISLLPVPATRKDTVVPTSADTTRVSFSIPDSAEYRDEDDRVEKMVRGDLSITEADLERIFRLRPIARAPAPPAPIVIQHIAGVRNAGVSVFGADGSPMHGPPATAATSGTIGVAGTSPLGYAFFAPGTPTTPGSTAATDCPTCNKR
jgi:Flp pilus assembly protein CpaB